MDEGHAPRRGCLRLHCTLDRPPLHGSRKGTDAPLSTVAPVLRSALVAAVVFAAATAGASAKVPASWVGVLAEPPIFDKHVKLDRELRTMRSARVGTVRIAFYGWESESVEGGPIDLSRSDKLILAAAKRGLHVLPVLLGSPKWARQDPKVDFSAPTAQGRFAYAVLCAAFVKRYGPQGTLWSEHPDVTPVPVRQYQIWNEPNGDHFWHETPRLPAYAKLLENAYGAIKANDPGATVILAGFPGDGSIALQRLYELGAGDSFDAVASHPFTFQVKNVKLLLERFHDTLAAHGDLAKPIYVTELSWPSAYGKTQHPYGFEVTEAEQAVKVRKAYTMLARERRRLNIAGVFWSSWLTRDRPATYSFHYAGLRRLNRDDSVTAKPAYRAFVKVIRKIAGA